MAYGILSQAVTPIMMLYINNQSLVRSPGRDTNYFDIKARILQGHTLAKFLFVITLV